MDTKNPIQSAERVFQVLELLAETGPVALKELCTRLDLHKSTIHRLLSSLVCMGYAMQDEESSKYMLTFKVVELSGKVLDHTGILPLAHPVIKRIAKISGETVHLVQRTGDTVVYIDKVEPENNYDRTIRMSSRIGLERQMYCSGVGKAILAGLPVKEVREIFGRIIIEQKTANTITTLDGMLSELRKVKKAGYAVDDEENEIGVRCVAVSMEDYSGKPKYAFSISAPAGRMDDKRLSELTLLLLEEKKKLQRIIGGDKN